MCRCCWSKFPQICLQMKVERCLPSLQLQQHHRSLRKHQLGVRRLLVLCFTRLLRSRDASRSRRGGAVKIQWACDGVIRQFIIHIHNAQKMALAHRLMRKCVFCNPFCNGSLWFLHGRPRKSFMPSPQCLCCFYWRRQLCDTIPYFFKVTGSLARLTNDGCAPIRKKAHSSFVRLFIVIYLLVSNLQPSGIWAWTRGCGFNASSNKPGVHRCTCLWTSEDCLHHLLPLHAVWLK